jgi:alcohol dehydrogenase class IV
VRPGRLAAIALALGRGDPGRDSDWNAEAAIASITELRERIGLAVRPADFGIAVRPADFGIAAPDFAPIAQSALADEVIANAPRLPTAAEIESILATADLPSPARRTPDPP